MLLGRQGGEGSLPITRSSLQSSAGKTEREPCTAFFSPPHSSYATGEVEGKASSASPSSRHVNFLSPQTGGGSLLLCLSGDQRVRELRQYLTYYARHCSLIGVTCYSKCSQFVLLVIRGTTVQCLYFWPSPA